MPHLFLSTPERHKLQKNQMSSELFHLELLKLLDCHFFLLTYPAPMTGCLYLINILQVENRLGTVIQHL